MKHLLCSLQAAALTCACGASLPANASTILWAYGTFKNPEPYPGGMAVVDSGERYGGWRVVGAPGTVAFTSGTYTHDGFSFPSSLGLQQNWVNLAFMSRSATGIAHAPVPTTVGAPYTLSFDVGNIVDPAGRYGTSSTVLVYANAKLIYTATNTQGAGTNTETWQSFAVTFTADAPYTSIAFINGDPPNDLNCGLSNTNLVPGTARRAAR